MHTLFIVASETSGGKDSLVNMACADKDLNMSKVVSYATRPKRQDERDDSHVFIKPEEVAQYKQDMIAYTKIGQYEYFATADQILNADFYILDPNGIKSFKYLLAQNPKYNDIRLVTIYINTPQDIRMARALLNRQDDFDTYMKRANDERDQFEEFKRNVDFDYAILNVDFNKSYKIFKTIIQTELADN